MSETPARLGSRYGIEVGELSFEPNTDVRRATANPVILLRDGLRMGELMRWGLVPF